MNHHYNFNKNKRKKKQAIPLKSRITTSRRLWPDAAEAGRGVAGVRCREGGGGATRDSWHVPTRRCLHPRQGDATVGRVSLRQILEEFVDVVCSTY